MGAILAPTSAIAVNEGEVMMITTYLMAKATTVNSTCVAIVAETSIDDTGTALTLDSGDLWPFYFLGCGEVVNVRSLTGQTWRFGAAVYNVQTGSTDGCVETNSASATKIGHYVGPDNVATSGVTLIRVLLDVAGGA
jgi:hypothetical protein